MKEFTYVIADKDGMHAGQKIRFGYQRQGKRQNGRC